jgi:hypothetical protein
MSLPLPLVPFESYMLADDRRAYPMRGVVRLRFSGQFARSALEEAVAAAVSRHPLLAAVACRSGRGWIWKPADCPPDLQWLGVLPGDALPPLHPLDVRTGPGLRVVVCEGPGRTDVILQVHHACSDAGGCLGFAEDLLVAYAMARGALPAGSLRPLRPDQLEGRGRFPWLPPGLLEAGVAPVMALGRVCRFLFCTPDSLVAREARETEGMASPDAPATLTRRLDESVTADLAAAAKSLGDTINDLLTRDLFLSLARWRQEYGADRQDARLRVCMPVSLRSPAHDQLPAANLVSMVFLDRRGCDAKDAGRLLSWVHRQMQRTKQFGLGPVFVHSVGVVRWLPGGLERACRNSRCMSTAVLSNLGVLFQGTPWSGGRSGVVEDGLVLEEVDAFPPLRPLTCAAFCAMTYGGRLSLTLHYDSRVLATGQAVELIDGFIDRVRRSAAEQGVDCQGSASEAFLHPRLRMAHPAMQGREA